MKRIFWLSLPLFLAACGGDPVQKDLINYINVEMPKVADLESDAVDAYASVSGENYENDSIMYYTIANTVIPRYEAFYEILESIDPATEEVSNLHHEYVAAAADQLEAFKLILEAIEKQDADIITQANTDLDKAKVLLGQWREDLDAACAKHHVVMEGEEEGQ
ncbi:MAG: hypothetical protein MUC38_04575 [Cyclobacteriaceae bacterium]|jgi:hypothetical protein|nr:hypothetical protein [Cyclobacteriaceae bacterium]